ncbi:hypothetical protein D3C76_1857250 [compost metagenome]
MGKVLRVQPALRVQREIVYPELQEIQDQDLLAQRALLDLVQPVRQVQPVSKDLLDQEEKLP